MKPGGDNVDNVHNWIDDHPERVQQMQGFGDQVRQQWNNQPVGGDWWSQNHQAAADKVRDQLTRPGNDWWSRPHPNLDHWYYHNDWDNHEWWYWWGGATWGRMTTWFEPWGWSNGVYYDYGSGGNVVYQDNQVYVNGQDVGTTEEYSQSAADLATVEPVEQEQAEQEQDDWLPLGTFALMTSSDDASPSRTIQLAVNKDGILSGTMHNSSSDDAQVVQGKVDKETQRVAFTIGDHADVVFETGIYNLTQDQTPVLVHRGTSKTETYMLVRLDPPQQAVNNMDVDATGSEASQTELPN